jgi:exo-beta-1,3-glucanase (GH17 family)
VPESSKPAVPAVPETSTTCTEEEGKPTGPAPVPEASKPAYPSVPEVTQPAYPSVPEVSKPAVPEVPEASKPAYPLVPEVSQPAYPAVPEVSKPAYTPEVPVSSKEVEHPKPTPSSTKSADKPKPTGSYNNGEHIVTNGDKWAITYTPYAKSGDCKTSDEIVADIKKISELGFTTIRSYSTDCGVFEYVVPECQKYGLKVIYGIFLEAGGKGGRGPFSTYANDQLNDIKEHAPKDSVAMVIVGNECVFNGNCDVNELGSYIDYVREELRGAGFPSDVAITTTETVGAWEEHGAALCSHIDIFAVQVHPYFTQSVTADMAGDFAAQQLEQAAKVCPEAAAKGKFITEIGWPSAGTPNGKAVAGVQEQKTAMKEIMEKVGSESCLFSFQDDTWKDAGALNVEQNFGCIDAIA